MDDRLHPMPIIVILFSNQMLNTYKGKLWECNFPGSKTNEGESGR